MSLTTHCTEKLAALEAAHLRRRLPAPSGLPSFASNDYCGLREHPRVTEAAARAARDYGAGAGASRLVTGNHALYAPLEEKLATLKGTQAALVFGSGYLANLGSIQALVGQGDLILADKLIHACMLDGAVLSGATLKRFAHNDVAHAQRLLQAHRGGYRHALILTESVFSMDGDKSPITELADLADAHDAWLMVDDAHGCFTPPPAGVDLWMGTLSKAAGGYGGYVAGDRAVIDYLLSAARSFVFSTGLPPATCAAALEGLRVLDDEPERRTRPLMLAQMFTQALGLPEAQSPIVPYVVGEPEAALALAERLRQAGILVGAIRPPTVPPHTARLRITFTANHTEEAVLRLVEEMKA